MASITLKVKPGELKKKSGEITKEINSIEKDMKEIDRLITGTKKYWQGDASDQHIQTYLKMKDDFTTIIKRLREHPTELEQMAGVYEEVESAVSQLSTALPTDVVSF